MRKMNLMHELRRKRFPAACLAIILALCLTLFAEDLSIVSHAESAGRVISADGANVRSTASATGSVVTSLAQNETVSIRSQIQASDGYTWYEIYVDADTLGYIRSDLVEITDGTTPPASTQLAPSDTGTSGTDGGTSGTAGTGSDQSPAEVTPVNPVSANVTGGGGTGVRIRSNASTQSQIVTTVQNGLALTVTGQAAGLDEDGKAWYQVNFISNGAEVSGFIRSDFVQLSEELTPYTDPAETDQGAEEEPEPSPEPETPKDYETVLQDGQWYLLVNATNQGYSIDELFQQSQGNTEAYEALQKTVKTEKSWIVILVILFTLAVATVAFLIYKIKDMSDSAYFNEVENETLRRRSEQSGRKVMQTVGAEKRGTVQGQRPSGARPAGSGQRPSGTGQGQRPSGARPAGSGQRPSGAIQGQRPSGAVQSQRPAGTAQGQRPSGTVQGQRPSGTQGQRPSGTVQSQRPAGTSQGQSASSKPSGSSQGWQSKNFMANEDDEFEFEFLNYDGDEEQ